MPSSTFFYEVYPLNFSLRSLIILWLEPINYKWLQTIGFMQMPSLSRALANHPINIPPEFPAILKAYTKVGHLKGQFNEIDSF
jgi:hypothetical protein